MHRFTLLFPLLLCTGLLQAQLDSVLIITMEVAEQDSFGKNNHNSAITISYAGGATETKRIPLKRRSTTGDPHVNAPKIAEAIKDIVQMGFELVEFDRESFPPDYYATYIFQRKE